MEAVRYFKKLPAPRAFSCLSADVFASVLLTKEAIRVRRAFFVFQFCLAAFFLLCVQSANATPSPTISPGTGLYFDGPTVSVSVSGGGNIFYTLDGSEPTQSSQQFSANIEINATTTVKAIAVQSGVPSAVATAVITVDPTIKPVVADTSTAPLRLFLRSDIGVTSSSGNVSSWLDVSGQGKTVTQSSGSNQPSIILNDYNGHPALAMASSKYFDVPSGFADIPNPAVYFVMKPSNTSNGTLIDLGNGSASDNITASSSGSSATFQIYQGSTSSSITASSALTLDQIQTLSMIRASVSGNIFTNGSADSSSGSVSQPNNTTRAQNHIGTDSSTSSNFYIGNLYELILYKGATSGIGDNEPDIYLAARYQPFTQMPPAPIISVSGGTLPGPTQVAIATPADCVVKFTTDGSTPNSGSSTYNGPVNIYYSQVLKAIAIKNGLSSSVASASYTLDSNQWPAPNPSDTTPLQVNVQSPVE